MNQPELQFRLFGPPEIFLGGRRLVDFKTAKTQALLLFLAATGKLQRRDRLASLFWGDMADAQARRNLTKSITVIKKLIPGFLVVEPQEISLDYTAAIRVDLHEFNELSTADEAGLQEKAAGLHTGEFLAGLNLKGAAEFDEWLAVEREHLARQAQRLLQKLTNRLIDQGEYDKASTYARRILALDPWQEAAHRQLMTVLARSGDLNAAIAQFERCRQILADDLGVEPMGETVRLYERIKDARDLKPRPIPGHLEQFVGREIELGRLLAMLTRPDTRLVTLLGVGGIGKTRLGLAAAARVTAERTSRFLNGVLFVPLAEVRTGQGMLRAIAEALGVPLRGRLPLKNELFSVLKNQEMLIVLDNFEQLLSEALLLPQILDHCPEIRMLVTSREPLKIAGEWRLQIAGLTYPPDGASLTGIDALLQFGAVQLFRQNARRVQPDYELTETEAPGVVRLCRMVEGMPLAILLSAPWIRVMPAGRIAEELAENLDILTTQLQDAPRRQRSMRAIFESTWRILPPDEQMGFLRASVFRGGFTEEAARQVLGVTPLTLASLVDRGLLRAEAAAGRYRIHELLRQFGREKLGVPAQNAENGALETEQSVDSELEQLEQQHSRFYLEFIVQLEPSLRGNKPAAALAEIWADLDNVRMAWARALAHENYGSVQRAVGGLSRFFDLAGLFVEGETHFSTGVQVVLEAADGTTRTPAELPENLQKLLVTLWVEQARLLNRRGLSARALEIIPQAVEIAAQLDDLSLEAIARHEWGESLSFHGEPEESERVLLDALDMARLAEENRIEAEILRHLGISKRYQGQFQAAVESFHDALDLFRKVEDQRGEGLTLNNLGILARKLGNFEEAERYYDASIRGFQEIGDQWGEGIVLNNMATLLHDLGRYSQAAELSNQGLVVSRQIKDLWGETYLLNAMGNTMRQLGDFFSARGHYDRCLRIRREIEAQLGAGETLSEIALLEHITGNQKAALETAQTAVRIGEEHASPEIEAQALTTLGHVYLALDEIGEAEATYLHAVQLWKELTDVHQILEAEAGLARVKVALEDWEAALALVEKLLPQLPVRAAVGTAEPFRIFTTCMNVLAREQDRRLEEVVASAFELLSSRAGLIADPRQKAHYLEKFDAHKRILSEAAAIGLKR